MTLITIEEFAYRNNTHPNCVRIAIEEGMIGLVDGMIDMDVAQPIWDSQPLEYIDFELSPDEARDLRAQAEKAGMTVNQYLRKKAGLSYPLQ